MAKLSTKYAVVELNNVVGVRTGELVAQYELAESVDQLENGMLVVANHATSEIELPKSETDMVYLHASVEKLYNGEGRNEFVIKKGGVLPRAYKLQLGDTFETNAVEYTQADIATLSNAITSTSGYGVPSTNGYITFKEARTAGAKVELKAIAVVTLPNGEYGIKWRVISESGAGKSVAA